MQTSKLIGADPIPHYTLAGLLVAAFDAMDLADHYSGMLAGIRHADASTEDAEVELWRLAAEQDRIAASLLRRAAHLV